METLPTRFLLTMIAFAAFFLLIAITPACPGEYHAKFLLERS
jgi:hypothetical protein